MNSLFQSLRGSCSPLGFILTVWLSIRIQQASCQEYGADVIAVVGESVFLNAPFSVDVWVFRWYRGTVESNSREILSYYPLFSQQINGPQYTGRERALPHGSLQIRDVLTNYTGSYTVTVDTATATIDGDIQHLRVFEPVSVPILHALTENLLENGDLVLFCNASGTDVSYRWSQNGLEVDSIGRISLTQNDQTLTVSPYTRSENGTIFTCWASNAVSLSSSSPYTAIISYPVSVPVLHALTRNPVEYGSLVLFCNASGTDLSYQWYQGTRKVVSRRKISLTNYSQTLTLSPCTRSDTGTIFTCQASNPISAFSSSPYNVTISYGPDAPVISVSPEKPFYASRSTLRLSCTAASYPPASYTWQLNGKSLPTIGQELNISNLALSDSGEYTCTTYNSVTQSTSYAGREIRVQDPVSVPAIHRLTRNPIENGALVLFCNASGTDVSYQWYQGDLEVISRGQISITNHSQTLTLSPCTKSDTDTIFTCRASNSINVFSSSPYTVTISYGPNSPVISVRPEKPFYEERSPLTLSCTAAAYPPASYTWQFNGTSLPTIGQELHIKNLTLSDSGEYTCTTYNSITQRSSYAKREIRILEFISQPTVRVGTQYPVEHRDSVELTCDASTAAETILWFFNNRSIPGDFQIRLYSNNQTLAISNVSHAHSGFYQCMAINPLSASMSDPHSLTVARPPPDSTGVSTSYWQITLGLITALVLLLSSISITVFLLYKKRRKKQKDEETHAEPDRTQDSTLCYENVIHVNPKQYPIQSSVADNIYEELQHGDQAMYESLKRYNADPRPLATQRCIELQQR